MATEILKAVKKQSPIEGNGLFAKEDIPAGKLIFSLPRPLLAAVDRTKLSHYCANCFTLAGDGSAGSQSLQLKSCAGCRHVWYCGKSCQAASWKRGHKCQCGPMKAIPLGQNLPHAARTVVQALCMRKAGKISDEEWNAFHTLPSHEDSLRQQPDWETHAIMALGALHYSGTDDVFDTDEAIGVYCRVIANSLTLTNPGLVPIGICLDPFACSANHSCDPNTFVVFDGPQIFFRALKPIAKDEEILVSYIDEANPFQYRQKELLERYHFVCNCSKCQKGNDAADERLPIPTPEQEQVMSKIAANLPKPAHSTSPLGLNLAAIEAHAFEVAEKEAGTPEADPRHATEGVVPALQMLNSTGIWPSHRQPFPALAEEFIRRESLFGPKRGNGYEYVPKSWLFQMHRYALIDSKLYPPHHPVHPMHIWSLVLPTMHIVKPDEFSARQEIQDAVGAELIKRLEPMHFLVDLINEMETSVKMSHGVDSTYGQQILQRAMFTRSTFEGWMKDMGWYKKYDEAGMKKRKKAAEDIAREVEKKRGAWWDEMMKKGRV
ncbi:hypothetical protein HDK90DRAFT_447532 [Phyllosticta capitalensis]|uniref:Suppressor of anucleate metulae protein B n=1 Tax=Phyllosticta capitalensis TaxID=121624 RepID=A0ABR1YYL0_9PEZI